MKKDHISALVCWYFGLGESVTSFARMSVSRTILSKCLSGTEVLLNWHRMSISQIMAMVATKSSSSKLTMSCLAHQVRPDSGLTLSVQKRLHTQCSLQQVWRSRIRAQARALSKLTRTMLTAISASTKSTCTMLTLRFHSGSCINTFLTNGFIINASFAGSVVIFEFHRL